jgi:periplasmic protein CpxP/Spy
MNSPRRNGVNLKSVLIVASLLVSSVVIAQGGAKAGPGGSPQTGRQQGGPGGQFRARTPEERVERLSKDLKLSADQKKKVLALYKANAPKQKALFDDKKMTREQKMAAFQKMREESTKKLKAILNKDQVKKLDEMRSRQRAGGPGGAGRGPAGSPPPKGGKAGGKG